MSKIIYVEGDLFNKIAAIEKGTVLVPHVCNNAGAWGAGFVVPLGKLYPSTRTCYFDWYDGKHGIHLEAGYYGDDKKLVSGVPRFMLGATQEIVAHEIGEKRVVVFNMIAQAGIGGKRPLRYDALAKCMGHVVEACDKCKEPSIHAPLFGAGLAGGNWDFIAALIEDTWLSRDIPVTIYYLKDKVPPGWTPPKD